MNITGIIALICMGFAFGFMAGYILARLEANKMFDLRDQNIQLDRNLMRWIDNYEEIEKRYKEVKEQLFEERSKKEEESEESKRTG